MTRLDAMHYACWLTDARDALERIGVPYMDAAAMIGRLPVTWSELYCSQYQPTGAAISIADQMMQEYTR
jgi:hypothetical protein